MPTVFEKIESGGGEDGVENQSRKVKFLVYLFGGETLTDARNAVASFIPDAYEDLDLQGVDINPTSEPRVIEFEAKYSNKEPKQPEKKPGEGEFVFDTTGGKEKQWYSKETIATFGVEGATAPDFKGGINVTKTGVEGADVVVPTFKFSIDRALANSEFNGDRIRTWFLYTGSVNDRQWVVNYRGVNLTFEEREVLFMGARGSQKGTEKATVNFSFEAIPNATNLSVGNGTIGTLVAGGEYRIPGKKGHDLLWVSFEQKDDADTHTTIQIPISAHIERLYDAKNFANLGL
jgi:hypothetical protein